MIILSTISANKYQYSSKTRQISVSRAAVQLNIEKTSSTEKDRKGAIGYRKGLNTDQFQRSGEFKAIAPISTLGALIGFPTGLTEGTESLTYQQSFPYYM